MSLYLGWIYGLKESETSFREAWAKTGKRLDMGKSCLRFRKLEDLALNVLGESIRRMPAHEFIQFCESVFKNRRNKC